MDDRSPNCRFCEPLNILMENDLAYALKDVHPVNPGHMLIIPKRHVADFFLVTATEKSALFDLLDQARHYLDGKLAPAGYNIGINIGEAAGQTVFHVHLHLIPRYQGDTENPRGGVRGVTPSRQSY